MVCEFSLGAEPEEMPVLGDPGTLKNLPLPPHTGNSGVFFPLLSLLSPLPPKESSAPLSWSGNILRKEP